jgi:hypothetical protein
MVCWEIGHSPYICPKDPNIRSAYTGPEELDRIGLLERQRHKGKLDQYELLKVVLDTGHFDGKMSGMVFEEESVYHDLEEFEDVSFRELHYDKE